MVVFIIIIHVITSGETLWNVSNQYNVDPQQIIALNGLAYPNQFVPGQALVIPVPGETHVIQAGETLWSIAQQYGVSSQALMQVNPNVDPIQLQIGEFLTIPPIVHFIQPGETVAHIAEMYGVSIENIVRMNQLVNENEVISGMPLLIPREKPVIEVNAYTYESPEEAVQSIQEVGDSLTFLSPFAYKITEEGTLTPLQDEEMIAAAREKNVVPMMAITNFTSTSAGSNLAHMILSNESLREKVIDEIIQVMNEKGYKGLNVDFENVLPEDRENYNAFLQLAVDRLHPLGHFVSTAVAPKVSGTQTGTLYEAHDYEAHGRIVDLVILMTYEWGYRFGPPQAISPLNEMRRVVEYALSVMPAEKIVLGFQIYARDWLIPHVEGQGAETFSSEEAINRAVTHGAVIQYDPVAQSPFFRYTDNQGQMHEVWFEDARSAQAKFDLIKEYNLRGVSYWALGYPFAQNWTLLNSNFTIKKE